MSDSIGTIGNGIWEKFTLYFDYPNHRLILEPNQRFDEEMQINHTGFLVRNDRGEKVVATVFPGTPADAAGILKDDILMKINKLKASDLTMAQLKKILLGPVGTPLKLKFSRHGKTVKTELILKNIL